MNINDHEDRSQLPDECEGATEAVSGCMNLLCCPALKEKGVCFAGNSDPSCYTCKVKYRKDTCGRVCEPCVLS